MNAKLETLYTNLQKAYDDLEHWNNKPNWNTWKGESKSIIIARVNDRINSIKAEIAKIEKH
jgi:hypothetical protein